MGIFKKPLKREGKVTIEELDAGNRNLYVVSDLHIASGLNPNGNYDGTENFYADQSFVRFINHLQETGKDNPAILIINGDFIDFLRIRDIPNYDALKKGKPAKKLGGKGNVPLNDEIEIWKENLQAVN